MRILAVVSMAIFLAMGCGDRSDVAGPPAQPLPKEATQAEMEAGTEAENRTVSPLLVAHAVAALAAEGATEVVDAAVGEVGDTDTTHAYSKDDIHDYVAQNDADYDGLPSAVEDESIDSDAYVDSSIDAAHLSFTAAPGAGNDNYAVTYDNGSGGFTLVELTGGAETNSLETVATGIAAGEIPIGTDADTITYGTDLPTATTIGAAYVYRAGGTDVADADVADTITITAGSQIASGSPTFTAVTAPTLTAGVSGTTAGTVTIYDAGTVVMGDDGDDTSVTIGPVADGTTTLGLTGSLFASGTISGFAAVTEATAERVLTTKEVSGGIVEVSAAVEVRLPDVCDTASGALVMITQKDDSETVEIAVTDTSDHLWLDGTDLGANYEIDSPGDAEQSNYIVLVCTEANNWKSFGRSGTWVTGGTAD